MNIRDYMEKHYAWPPCWRLVADVYCDWIDPKAKQVWVELLDKDLDKWFAAAVMSKQIPVVDVTNQPIEDYDVFYMKNAAGGPHVGIMWKGKMLHADTSVLYEDLETVVISYTFINRWRYALHPSLQKPT